MTNQLTYILFALSIFILTSNNIHAQVPDYYKEKINLDSIISNDPNAVIFMKQVNITPEHTNMSRSERRRYTKLIRNFKKTYPYAKLLSNTMDDIEYRMQFIPDEKVRKRYINSREKAFRKQYEEEIKKLTISQGLLLIKLIDRETGETSFDIIKEFKGGLLAGTYQTLARIFGHNLKTNYDANGEDKEIEYLVAKYENGQL